MRKYKLVQGRLGLTICEAVRAETLVFKELRRIVEGSWFVMDYTSLLSFFVIVVVCFVIFVVCYC